MRQSIKEKILCHLLAIGLLSILLTAILSAAMFYRAFVQQIRQELSTVAQEISTAYDPLSDPEQLSGLGGGAVRITLISSNGTVRYDNTANGALENHLTRPEIQQALAEGAGWDQRTSDTLGYSTYYYALRLENGEVLRVAMDAQDLYAVYNSALPAVAISCGLILLLSGWLSLFLSRRLVQPIEQMAGDLEHIGEHIPYRELEPFARTIQQDQQNRKSSEKLRQEFTANVSHELKTPLTSISGYAELIASGMAKPEDVRTFAEKIQRESGRLLTLIGDIIQLSELDSSDENPQLSDRFEPVDLMEVAQECVNTLQVNAQKAYVTLLAEGVSTFVQGDRGMLMELCTNLCDNAIRYNRAGGKVVVRVHSLPEGVQLQVMDNGIGIPPEHQQRVFERFYRVDKSRSKATGGTGLGLAIVKHISMLHGAKITLESQEGKGTVIKVLFPHRDRH